MEEKSTISPSGSSIKSSLMGQFLHKLFGIILQKEIYLLSPIFKFTKAFIYTMGLWIFIYLYIAV